MRLRTIFSLFLLAISAAFIFAAADTQPKIFAPGVISGPANDGTPTFTKDEKTLVFTRSGAGWSIIMESHKTGEQWSQPEIAKFSGEWLDMQPVFSPDGSYLIYVSTRPVPDAATHTSHLWRVDRIGNGWGEPKLLPDAINANPRVFKPSIAADGSLYFMTMDKGKKFRLVHSQFANGSYGQAESLPFSDGTTGDVDPEIAPDGSYLIFSSNGRTDGDTDHERMFIVFRSGDSWARSPQFITRATPSGPRATTTKHT